MTVVLLTVPYDSGHRARRMGRGPLHLVAQGALDTLRELDPDVRLVPVESALPFPTEIGTAFELHRTVAERVAAVARDGGLPLVLSGNCNAAIGTTAGLHAADPDAPLGVLWFDGHGDCNTPETFTGSFLDAMGLSTLTGRCWAGLCATVPGFRPVPDAGVVLVGAHGADRGALAVLAASGIGHVRTAEFLAHGSATTLGPALDALARAGVRRVYLHLDPDVLDAAWAPANGFAPAGGLLPEALAACVAEVTRRFTAAAAAVASYDPECDRDDRVLGAALGFLRQVAASRVVPPR
jgi:arginase